MIKTPEQIFKEKKISGYINPTFAWSDFVFPEDGIPPLEYLKNLKSVATVLSVYKNKLFKGNSITITSGYRSIEHHLRVYREKGITDRSEIPMNSLHLKGLAADFRVNGFDKRKVYELMDLVHFGGVEFPDEQNRIHIDLRGEIVRFIGKTGRRVAHHYNNDMHTKVFYG